MLTDVVFDDVPSLVRVSGGCASQHCYNIYVITHNEIMCKHITMNFAYIKWYNILFVHLCTCVHFEDIRNCKLICNNNKESN